MEHIEKTLELNPDNYIFLHTKGWGLYQQGKYQQALQVLEKSWELKVPQNSWDLKPVVHNYEIYLHLEASKKAVANQKNN